MMINDDSLIHLIVDVRRHPLNIVPNEKRLSPNALIESMLKLLYPTITSYAAYIKHHPNDFKDKDAFEEFWNNKRKQIRKSLENVVGNIDVQANYNRIYTETHRLATENMDSKICTEKWSTIGDLHGSSLKFFYFLLLQGIVAFKKDQKAEELYEDFYDLYLESFGYTSCAKSLTSDILPFIDVTKNARVRLVGDETGDRCSNDYFMLKLIEKLIDGGAQVETLISNHGLELIKAMEAVLKDPNLTNIDPGRYQEQYASTQWLKQLIEDEVVTLDQVKALYEKYKKTLKAFSYDYNDAGNLVIYGHAPMNELDILDIAQHLINRHNNNEAIMSKDCYDSLLLILNRLNSHQEMLQPEDIIKLIDHINSIVQYNADLNALGNLIAPHKILAAKLANNEIDEDTEFDIRNGNGINPLTYGLHYATHNRDDPNKRVRSRPKNPDVVTGHGHDDSKFDHCVCFDNILCKSKTNNIGVLNISVTHPNKPVPKLNNKIK